MKEGFSGGVWLLVPPPPNVLVREPSETALNLWQEILRQMMLRARDESLTEVTHSSPNLSPLPRLILPGGVCVSLSVAPDSPFLQAWRARSDSPEAPTALG